MLQVFSRRLWIAFFASFLAVALGLSQAAHGETIAIAVAVPLTGTWAEQGLQIRRGAEAAAQEINDHGGINGDKIEILAFDDKGTSSGAISAAKKLVKQGIRFVIGHYNSGASIPMANFYSKNNTLMISPASTNPALTEMRFWNVARTAGRDDVQGAYAGEYILKHYAGKRVALIGDGTPYSEGLLLAATASLKAGGSTVAARLKVKLGQTNFGRLVKQLNDKKIEVAFFAGLSREYGNLLREVGKANLRIQFISGDGTLASELPTLAGSTLEGSNIVFSLMDETNPAAASAVSRLRAAGVNRFDYTLKAYAAVQVIAAGIERSDSQAPRAVAQVIRSGASFPTALGSLSFDANGDRKEPDVMMYVWRQNRMAPGPNQ